MTLEIFHIFKVYTLFKNEESNHQINYSYLFITEKTGVQEIAPESQTSNRRTGCNIKNGECVPKCSELSEEQRNKGLQCEVGKSNKE